MNTLIVISVGIYAYASLATFVAILRAKKEVNLLMWLMHLFFALVFPLANIIVIIAIDRRAAETILNILFFNETLDI